MLNIDKPKNVPNINRIAIISRTDSSASGSGVVAEELANLINQSNLYQAHLWRGFSNLPKNENTFELYGNNVGEFVYKLSRYLSRKSGLVDFIPFEILTHNLTKPFEYDLYHFHSISAAASPIFLRWVGKRKPTIWTFHECAPFTGGCIYPSVTDCHAYTDRCGQCSQLDMWPFLTSFDYTGFAQDYKKKLARENLFIPVVPSHWLAKEVVKSGMCEQEPIVIPNCIDTSAFKPIDKFKARASLNLPQDRFVILIGAAFINNKRKGIKYALEAISLLDSEPYVLAVGGQSDDLLKQKFPIRCAGYIQDKTELAHYYSAADVFVFPTLADNHPLAAIEAMACGTPVIGFRTGGVPEIIDHNINGWLVDQKDVSGLVSALNTVMSDSARLPEWAENGLNKVKKCYNPELFLMRHRDLYESLLQKDRPTQ
jgi:glycosyltransferase involved in cell wall biosynthesis